MELGKSRPEDWTKADEQFKEMVDKLVETDPDLFACEIQGEIDYSFLNRRRQRHHRTLIVAAAFLLVIFLSGTFGIWLNHESAVAAKFELERILHNIRSGLAADKDSTYTVEEGTAELTVQSLDHIDVAQNFLPELILPASEPAGYSFEEIAIQKSVNNYWVVSILYTSSEGDALSVGYMNFEQESSVGVSNHGTAEEVEVDGVAAYFWSEITGTSVLNFIDHNILFTISSTKANDKENLLDIAKLFIQ